MSGLQRADDVRRAFIEFFEAHDHLRLPSASLVPEDDPTLLFTSAGMVQMKPYFMGLRPAPHRRLVTAQKCFRTVDIDQIGNERTLTFFEMLGNFSVGDYFKEGAIELAWELVTKGYGFPPERLWVTVHHTDDEAAAIWETKIGFPKERIVRLGDEHNWWAAGDTGPCGPDSEIYYDRGEEHGCGKPDCKPGCDCERYLEFWNLVFMQYNRHEDGSLSELPTKNIDTGNGLERTAMLLQGVNSVYETDLFRSVMRRGEELAGVRYGEDPKVDFSLRVIADHSRAVTFLAADGVLPGSEGRGYVMRRILRRAVWHGRLLGLGTGFLTESADSVISLMGHAYPELIQRREAILAVISNEERRFGETLEVGLRLLNEALDALRERGETVVPGGEAFRLHDTYGFPIELTIEVAEREGFSVDRAGFDAAMERQRQMAREAARFGSALGPSAELYADLPATEFVGYDTLRSESEVLALVVDGQRANEATEGQEAQVVLRTTPFYAEAGGQVGDRGELIAPNGRLTVRDTRRHGDVTVHYARVEHGRIEVTDLVAAAVDPSLRRDTMRNHTATHLLHAALHRVLGAHALQRGSLVAPDRLRFDFSHGAPMTPEEIVQVERIVNEAIREDDVVQPRLMPYREAIEGGATALFSEKYRDVVRVIDIHGEGDEPSFSRELCGGTHVRRTGEIGFFKVVSESSAAAGIRRIEALTGRGAEEWVRGRLETLDRIGRALRSNEPEARIAELQKEIDRLRRELANRERGGRSEAESLLARAEQVDGVTLIRGKIDAPSYEAMLALGDDLKARLGAGRRGLIVLASQAEDRPLFVAMATKGSGIEAGQIVKAVSEAAGGKGGGRGETARGGGGDPARIDAALAIVPSLIRS